ncbi:MAG: response regulator [Burkholderiales bacterium]|nr:response regulator [Anaerolineae bacterium]
MLDPKTVTWEAFEQHVQSCLQHLYDYGFLLTHPLVQWLVPDESGPERVEIFRELCLETIERLRPGANVSFHAKASRDYNILMLRFVSQQSIQEVAQQLSYSERQFYRDYPKALASISGILWERLTGTPVPTPIVTDSAEISLETEVQHAHTGAAEPSAVDLQALLTTVVHDTRLLAEQYQVEVTLSASAQMAVRGDGMVLRQAALALMSHLITRTPTSRLDVDYAASGSVCRVRFRVEPAPPDLAATLEQQSTLQFLVKTLDAVLSTAVTYSSDTQVFEVALELKARQQTLLIVDDNPDALDLFERYLAGQPYDIQSVREGTAAVQIARDTQPDIIILDLMMPGTDGLEIMQNLKNHAATSHIPVLICSVLEMQDLALSLRADGYLKKPPGQADLLNVLAQWR